MRHLLRKVSFDVAVVAIITGTTRLAGSQPQTAKVVVGIAVVVGFVIGLVVHGSRQGASWRRSWWLLGAGLVLLVVANAGAVVGPFGERGPDQPGWPLAGVVVCAAVLRMLHHRLPSRASEALSEASLTVAALGFVVWMLPMTANAGGAGGRAAALAAPMLDIVALWLLARLISLTGRHPAAYRYLFAGLVCLFTVDAVVAASALTGQAVPFQRLEALELWAYCLFAAAAVHPSLAQRFEPVPPRGGRPSRGHLAVVGAVALVGPLALAARLTAGGEILPAFLVASATLPLLVVVHLVRQVRERAGAEYRAQHDALSGLPNRTLFNDRLGMAVAHARRSGGRLGVLFLDLDRFKNVNDSLGHDVGNVLLQGVASRLRHTLREEDTVARLGGDEFTVLLPGIERASDCSVVAQKLLAAFEQPFAAGGRQLVATASIGVAVFPDDGEDAEALLMHADTAMYRAKSGGRATYQCYTADMSARARARHSLESNLHAAVERGELTVHYQPKVSLRDLGLVGVEALARWRHPRLGFVPPAAFIPVAEESGLILSLGEWVLDEACRQGQEWRAAGLPVASVAVNLSARQITQQDVPALVSRVLGSTGFDGRLLEVELTEGIFLKNHASVSETLRRL